MPRPTFFDAIDQQEGKNVWGLKRSVGSAFFIDFGKPIDRKPVAGARRKAKHGSAYILSQLAFWKILENGHYLLGSEDTQEKIDELFSNVDLGKVRKIEFSKQSLELKVFTTHGYNIEYYWFGDDDNDEISTVWTFFFGKNESWSLMTDLEIMHEE